MNYNLSVRYKFYSTIINVCFESLRESNNEDVMKKYDISCILVSGYGSTIKSTDVINATVDYFHHHFYMHNIFFFISQMRAFNNNYCSITLEKS